MKQVVNQKRRLLVAIGAIVAVGLAVGLPLSIMGQEGVPLRPPPPNDRSGGNPLTPPKHIQLPPPVTDPIELARARSLITSGQADRVELSNGGAIVAFGGPTTRGKSIEVAGTTLQLPSDAFVYGIATSSEGGDLPGAKPFPLPAYEIRRGGGMAFVAKATGEFQIAIGPRELFQFLADALGVDREVPWPHPLRQQSP
jgi:hypothetical protein